MGYPSHEESIEMIERKFARPTLPGGESVGAEDIRAAAEELKSIYIHHDVIGYAAAICEETRHRGGVVLGASPRALIHLLRVSQGYAALADRVYVLPDDIKRAARPVLSHRIIFNNSFLRTEKQGENLIDEILATLPVPSENIDFTR
jgi:MoxR-like ATPase